MFAFPMSDAAMGSDDKSARNDRRLPPLLRRADQLVVAGLVLAGLVSTVGWWVAQGGLQGRMLEVERADPQTADFVVDLNKAEWPELAQLPGIGEKRAKQIVDSRKTDGPFLDNDDLTRVRGIGPKTLEGVRPYLRPMPPAHAVAGQ